MLNFKIVCSNCDEVANLSTDTDTEPCVCPFCGASDVDVEPEYDEED